MLWGWLFFCSVLAIALYVIAVGSGLAKIATISLFMANALTAAAYALGTHKWLPMNQTVVVIDLCTLAIFIVLASRSNALWPVFLVGWQLATITIHISSLFAVKLVPDAYGIGQGIWAYLQFATIFGVTVRERRRLKQNSLLTP